MGNSNGLIPWPTLSTSSLILSPTETSKREVTPYVGGSGRRIRREIGLCARFTDRGYRGYFVLLYGIGRDRVTEPWPSATFSPAAKPDATLNQHIG